MMTDADTAAFTARKVRASAWFRALQEDIIARFEAIEDAGTPHSIGVRQGDSSSRNGDAGTAPKTWAGAGWA
nr:hypothetical protein [Hyphomonas sp.]